MFGFGEEFFTDEYIMEISSNAMYLILLLSAPMLMSALGVGLVISILQATTQIQEQTLSFVPKLLATFLSCLICGTWISSMVGGFATRLFTDIENFGPKRAPAVIMTENAAKEKAGPRP
ncbi:flagellar biosynthesis protein FliQ [bacterium]|nr:flagellar biosynthesis protein FliQ [bacterium]